MAEPTPALPWDEPKAVIASVQQRVLRGMVWSIAGYGVIQVLLWHTRPVDSRPVISYAFEAILLTGLTLQYLGLNRLNIRQNGILFISWLGLIDLMVWTTSGPEMGSAIALVCTILVALFFINKRAGAVVVGTFGLYIILHAVLVGRGVLQPYSSMTQRPVTTLLMLRAGLSAFGVLAVGFAIFAQIHHVLFQSLSQMAEERRRRDQAEAAHRKAEEIMRANQHFEALGKLASGVAHDVNNALTVVLGNAELLKLGLPPGEKQMFAQDILTAAKSAAQTTRQLLSLTRHSGHQPVQTDPALVARSVSRLVSRLLSEHIRLEVECHSRRSVLVDPADLHQALLNLLLNARDAVPSGGVIHLRTEDDESGGVRVSVSDNGRGIPDEVRSRIFEPFFTTKPAGQGTGLGLAMVRTFAEDAAGRVSADNLPAGGACFTLTFPACPAPAPIVAPPPRTVRPVQNILLVEEQPDLRQLMQRVMQGDGHQVTGVTGVGDALQRLQAGEKYQLLCADLQPDGQQVLNLIVEFQRDRASAPVLLSTGHAHPLLAGGRLPRPGVQVINKPFTGTEYLTRVQQMILAERP